MGNAHQGLYKELVIQVVFDIADIRAVYFNGIKLQPAEIAEAAVGGTKVVDGEFGAQLPEAGGKAAQLEDEGYRFDIGGHRFFSKSQQVVDLWNEILPDDFIQRPRMSRIYYEGKFYSYPLRAFEALWNLGIWRSALAERQRMVTMELEGRLAAWASEQLDVWLAAHRGDTSAAPSQQPAPSGGKAGKGFVIKKLAIENVTVHLSGFGKEMEPIKLPPIVLENIGSESTGGVVASQLAGIVLRQIMIEVMKNPGQLPAFALASLNQGLAGVGSLGEVGLVRVGKVGEDVNSLISGAGGDVESAVGNVLGEGAGKAAGGVFDSLGAASENAVKGQTDKLGDKMNENLNKASGALGNLLGGDKQQQQDEQDKSQ